jgi:hypothetical protein
MNRENRELSFPYPSFLMKLGFLCLLFFTISFCSLAQKIEKKNSEEEMDTTAFKKMKNGYNYIIRADREETRLFKIDLLPTVLYPLVDFDELDSIHVSILNLEYERKIKPNLSWLVGLEFATDGKKLREITPMIEGRYYYNMNKRILKGKSANNFSANYFGAFLRYSFETQSFGSDGSIYGAKYGVQRRLGRYGYFDFDLGVGHSFKQNKSEKDEVKGLAVLLGFKIGLAF